MIVEHRMYLPLAAVVAVLGLPVPAGTAAHLGGGGGLCGLLSGPDLAAQ